MLFSWMKSLITYLLLAGIVVNLSPAKNYKRYISFFSGLVVIIIISEPIAYVFNAFKGDLSGFADSVDGYLMYNYDVNEGMSMYDYYDMSYEESVLRFLRDRGIDVETVSVITDEDKNAERLYIYLKKYEGEGISVSDAEIKKYLQEVYNLDFDSIYVIRR